MSVKKTTLLVAAVSAMGAMTSTAFDITVADGIANTVFNGGGLGSGGEDNETESGTTSNQTWDLERFWLSGSSLSLVGGFDMKTGQGFKDDGTPNVIYPMGDIFVRINKPVYASYNTATDTMTDAGYDYIIRFNSFGAGTVNYTIYDSTAAAILTGPPPSGTAHPGIYHLYSSGGTVVAGPRNGTYIDNSGADPRTAGLLGDTFAATIDEHDILTVDITELLTAAAGKELHFLATMDCGNDVILGKYNVADSGLTLAMLGLGFAGLGLALRKR